MYIYFLQCTRLLGPTRAYIRAHIYNNVYTPIGTYTLFIAIYCVFTHMSTVFISYTNMHTRIWQRILSYEDLHVFKRLHVYINVQACTHGWMNKLRHGYDKTHIRMYTDISLQWASHAKMHQYMLLASYTSLVLLVHTYARIK